MEKLLIGGNTNSLYFPDGETSNLVVKVNFIIWTKPDGTGNFEAGNGSHMTWLDDLRDLTAARFRWMSQTQNPDDIEDCENNLGFNNQSKFELDISYHWIADGYAWNIENAQTQNNDWFCPSTWAQDYEDYTLQLLEDNDIPEGINVFFGVEGGFYQDIVIDQITNTGFSNTRCSEWPSTTDLDKMSRISMHDEFLNYYTGDLAWIRAGILAHQLC